MKDVVYGVAAGLAGAALWAGIAVVTGYEVGWIAWGVGALVGYAVAFGNSDGGRDKTHAGVIAVAITILSIAAGKYGAVELMMPSDDELVAMFTQGFEDEEYVMSFLADDVVTEFEEAGRPVEWPASLDEYASPSAKADYPADVWGVAAERWGAMTAQEQAEYRQSRESDAAAEVEANLAEIRALVSQGGFFGSFTPMDLLFFGLGTVTAWGAASGRKSKQEISAAYQGALLLSMLKVTTADGVIHESEVVSIRRVLRETLGRDTTAADIRAEAEKAMADTGDLLGALRELSPHLDISQREGVVRAAVQVALADGGVGAEERLLIEDVARAIDVSDAHLRGILSHVVAAA